MKQIIWVLLVAMLTNTSLSAMGEIKETLPNKEDVSSNIQNKTEIKELQKSKIKVNYDIRIKVDSITNSFARQNLSKAFLNNESIKEFNVRLEYSHVDLLLKPKKQITDEEIRKRVEEAGFKVIKILRAIP